MNRTILKFIFFNKHIKTKNVLNANLQIFRRQIYKYFAYYIHVDCSIYLNNTIMNNDNIKLNIGLIVTPIEIGPFTSLTMNVLICIGLKEILYLDLSGFNLATSIGVPDEFQLNLSSFFMSSNN